MTDLPLNLAPGCFGSAMTFSKELAECQACPFAAKCEVQHLERRAALQIKFGVTPKVRVARTAFAMTGGAPAHALVDGLPKKVGDLLARIERHGIHVTTTLAAGKNPFPAEPKGFSFLRTTVWLLSRMGPRGVDRQLLMECFMKKEEWSQNTAAAHVTQAIQVLQALGVAELNNGHLTLKGTLNAKS